MISFAAFIKDFKLNVTKGIRQEEKWFLTLHLKNDLKAHSVKGGLNTVGGQLISFIMSVSSTIIMARLLTPADYGLVAMVTAVTGFILIFRDMGLAAAIIQKETINQQQVSAIFWINVCISAGIALIIAGLAPVLANFYEEPRLLRITLVFALSMFFAGLSLQHDALMKRQMKFKTLSLIQISSMAGSILSGIGLAWAGFGYWAIVATAVLPPVFSTVALWFACDWRPDFAFKTTHINSFLKFGAGLAGFDLVNYFSRNMDNVIIGRFAGSVALGIYTKAYQLLMLPITQLRNPLNAVALPALSSLQGDAEKFANFYSRYLFTLAFLSMPVVVYAGIFSEKLILILMGSQWIEASDLFRILALSAFMQPVLSTQGLILIATGRIKRYFISGTVHAVLAVTGFAVGIRWGVEGVAASQPVVMYALMIPALFYNLHGTPVSVSRFLKEVSLPVVISLTSGAAMLAFRYFAGDKLPDIFLCAAGFLIGAALYFLLWFISPATRQRFRQMTDMAAMIRKKQTK